MKLFVEAHRHTYIFMLLIILHLICRFSSPFMFLTFHITSILVLGYSLVYGLVHNRVIHLHECLVWLIIVMVRKIGIFLYY